MSKAVLGDPNIYWADFMPFATCDPLPKWPHRKTNAFSSPCLTRNFMTLAVASNGEKNLVRYVAVEYLPNDPLLLELELGGGITWADYFLDHEKLLMIDTTIFGPSESSLVDGRMYHKEIEGTLGHRGNTHTGRHL